MKVSANLNESFTRLSSGLRINRASDDAAGLAISESLSVDSQLYSAAIRNSNDGISALDIAESALSELSNVVVRIAELAEQSANGTLSTTQRWALDNEAQALRSEYQRIAETTSFNGISLLDGSTTTLSLQVGINSSKNSQINTQLQGAATRYVGNLSFESSQINVASGGGAGAIADFNEDGIADIIELAPASGSEIFLGNGDGTYATGATLPGLAGREMVVDDFNNDGHLDILGAGFVNGANLALGNGDGTFQANIDTGADDAIAVGDFNKDGILDIAASARFSDDDMEVFLGIGNGTFAAGTIISGAQVNSNRASTGDFDNDGDIDIAVSDNNNGGSITMFANDGAGNFTQSTAINFILTGPDVEYGDFNNDGYLDALATTGGGAVEIALGNGDLTFTTHNSFTFGNGWSDMRFGDFNDDGNLDAVLQNVTGSLIAQVYTGDGTGNLTASTSLGSGSYPWGVQVGDLNGDGVLDIAIGDRNDHVIELFTQGADVAAGMSSFSLLTSGGSLSALDDMKQLLQDLASSRGEIGASLSRLGITLNNLASSRENVASAASRIKDADIAEESSKLILNQILQQSATAVLAQANQLPALALQLLN